MRVCMKRGSGLTSLANVHDHDVLVLPERVGHGGLRQEFVTRHARESASQTRLSGSQITAHSSVRRGACRRGRGDVISRPHTVHADQKCSGPLDSHGNPLPRVHPVCQMPLGSCIVSHVLFTMEASAQSYHLAGHRAAAKHRDEEYVVAGHFARG
jgi:hypothetical protein